METALSLLGFAGFTVLFAKFYFQRKHADIAAAKKAAAARRYCPTCGHPLKEKKSHE